MNEQSLKRFQLWLAIVVGVISFAVAAHNFKNIYLKKPSTQETVPPAVQSAPSPLRTAIEEVGASWIKKIGSPRNEIPQNTVNP